MFGYSVGDNQSPRGGGMKYEDEDIGFLRTLIGNNFVPGLMLPTEIRDILKQTEIFHFVIAAKLIRKVINDEEFNLDFTGMDKKLDMILEELKKESSKEKIES